MRGPIRWRGLPDAPAAGGMIEFAIRRRPGRGYQTNVIWPSWRLDLRDSRSAGMGSGRNVSGRHGAIWAYHIQGLGLILLTAV